MCELCDRDPEKLKAAREHQHQFANSLRSFAEKCDRLSSGSMKPHGSQTEAMEIEARHLIRVLVAEWL